MKKIAKLFSLMLVSAGALTSFTACENDAPVINANWSYSHITDLSTLVEAVNNNTATMKLVIDEKGNLLINAIDRNGEKIATSITDGFSSIKGALGTLNDNLVLKLDANTAALVNFDTNTQKSLNDLIAKADEVGGKIVTAVDNNGNVIATAVEKNGDVIAAQILASANDLKGSIDAQTTTLEQAIKDNTEAIKVLNNTVEAAGRLIQVQIGDLATDLKTSIATLDEHNSASIDALKDALNNGLSDINTSITDGFTNLTNVTDTRLSEIFGKLTDLNNSVSGGFSNLNQTITTGLANVTTQIQNTGNTVVSAIDRNTVAVTGVSEAVDGVKVAITTFDDNTTSKLGDLIEATEDQTTKVVATMLTTNEALIAAIDENGQLIAAGITNVTTQLTNMNNNLVNLQQLLDTKLTAVIGKLGDIDGKLGNINTAIGTFDANQKASMQALKEAIEEQGGKIETAITTQGGLVVAAIDRNGAILAQINGQLEATNTIFRTFNTDFNTFKTDLIETIDNQTDELTYQLISFEETNEAALKGLKDALNTQGANLVAAVNDHGDAVVLALNNNGQAITDAVTAQTTELSGKITNLQDALKQAVNDQTATLNTRLQGIETQIMIQGTQLWQQLATANQNLSSLNDKMNTVASSVSAMAAATNALNLYLQEAMADVIDELGGINTKLGKLDKIDDVVAAINTVDADLVQNKNDLIAQMQSDVTTLETALNGGFTDVTDAIKLSNTEIATLTTALEAAATTLESAINDQTSDLQSSLDDGVLQLVDIASYLDANGTVLAGIETNTADLAAALQALGVTQEDIKTILDALSSDIDASLSALGADIDSSISTAISDLTGGYDLSDIEAAIAGNQIDLTTLEGAVGDVEAAIAALTTELQSGSDLLTAIDGAALDPSGIITAIENIGKLQDVVDEIVNLTAKLEEQNKLINADPSLPDLGERLRDIYDKLEGIRAAI